MAQDIPVTAFSWLVVHSPSRHLHAMSIASPEGPSLMRCATSAAPEGPSLMRCATSAAPVPSLDTEQKKENHVCLLDTVQKKEENKMICIFNDLLVGVVRPCLMGLNFAAKGLNVSDVIKTLAGVAFFTLLNLAMLCSCIAGVRVLSSMRSQIESLLEGTDFNTWMKQFLVAAGELNVAEKAYNKNPDKPSLLQKFQEAQHTFEPFKQLLESAFSLLDPIDEMLMRTQMRLILKELRKAEGFAAALDPSIYVSFAIVVVEQGLIVAKGLVLILRINNCFIIGYFGMTLPGSKKSLKDIEAYFDEHPETYSVYTSYIHDIVHDDRENTFRSLDINMLINLLRAHNIQTVMCPGQTGSGLAGGLLYVWWAILVNLANKLKESGIDMQFMLPYAKITPLCTCPLH